MMSQGYPFSRYETIQLVMRLSIITAATYFTIKWVVNQMDPTSKSKNKSKEEAHKRLRKLGHNGKSSVQIDNLTDYEMMIAAHLVVPDDITVSWDDIAGLDDLIQELKETVILPIQRRELFADSHLTQPPKGVLLHGPPGVGKTLIAKATAKEAKTHFINLDMSILTDKWYGESPKLAAAVFSLAAKLQPCIVFIDEIDSFLRSRNHNDHEATAMMKAQFLYLWDGLNTDPNCTVIIMGATNRPSDLDKAIQRRMPATFRIGLPDLTQREHILNLIISKEPVSEDVNLNAIAKLTNGLSGSDLYELCRNASVYRVRDFMKKPNTEAQNASLLPDNSESTSMPTCDMSIKCREVLRPITMDDLLTSLKKFKESNNFTANTWQLQ